VGGPIADEHRPKSELYSGKANVTGFLSWSERPLIVLLGHSFCLIGGFAGKGWTVRLETVLSDGPSVDDVLGDDLHRISVLCEIHSWAGRGRRAVCVACINLYGYRPV